MKRQVNLMVKLLVMLTLTLQLMPFSVVAETLAQTPTAATTENVEGIEQLKGVELQSYLATLTEVERHQIEAELTEEQLSSLAALKETTGEQTDGDQGVINEVSQDSEQLPVLNDSQPTSDIQTFDTSSSQVETSTSDASQSEEPYIGAAANFLSAGPLSTTLAAADTNLVLNKTATYNEAQKAVDFQLEAYAKGEVVTSSSQVDVVFVLDVSLSMDDTFSNKVTKLAALKTAVTNFADSMKESQTKLGTGQYHTMRLVTYARNAATYPTTYRTDNSANVTNFKNTVNGLSTASATRQDRGLANAEEVVISNKKVPNRNANQVVILFTDGEPADNDATVSQIAGGAVNTARRIKQELGATIYSIGIQNNANPTIVGSQDVPNSMLNGISSNYPKATVSNINNYQGTLFLDSVNPKGANYYLTTTTAGGLSSIFQSIATEIGKIDNLTIRDVLTEEPFFSSSTTAIDLSTVKVYKAWTYAPSLVPISNAVVAYGINTKTVDVKNVNLDPVIFNGSTPTEATKNNKVIIRFSVKVQEDFMGGNQVITNEGISGAYTTSDGVEQLVKVFDIPKVNIPLKDAGIKAKDQKIYLGNSAQVGNFYTNLAKLNGKNNRYVNVTYKIEKGASVLAEKTIPAGTAFQDALFDSIRNETEDVIYKVSYAVVPALSATPSVVSLNKSENVNVYVFNPLLAAPDRHIYLTNSVNINDKLPVITEWQHPKAATLTQLDFTGTAPSVTGAKAASMDLLTEEVVNGSLNEVTLSNNAKFNPSLGFKVYVFRPEITSSNKQIELGDSTTLQERKVKTSWKNTKTTSTVIEGTEPVVSAEPQKVGSSQIEPAIVSPSETTNYAWLVKANNQNVSQYTSHVNADYGTTPKPAGAHFTIYVATSRLTIKKDVIANGPRTFGDETFLFEITWRNGQKVEVYYQTITLNENQTSGQTTLMELKAGTYSIKEISEWSSRYEADTKQKDIQISSKNPGTATFKNTLKNTKWLSHETKAVNQYNPVPKKRADVR